MDHTAIIALVGGILAALGALIVRVIGDPTSRMKHVQRLEEIEAKAEASRVKATERLIASWEMRARDLEQRLNAQAAQQALLSDANATLRERVDALEHQLQQAGLLHKADVATIAGLRHELEQAREELAAAREEIAELLARVSELDTLLHKRTDAKAKTAKKKGSKNV